jgi:hypothetical protein
VFGGVTSASVSVILDERDSPWARTFHKPMFVEQLSREQIRRVHLDCLTTFWQFDTHFGYLRSCLTSRPTLGYLVIHPTLVARWAQIELQ